MPTGYDQWSLDNWQFQQAQNQSLGQDWMNRNYGWEVAPNPFGQAGWMNNKWVQTVNPYTQETGLSQNPYYQPPGSSQNQPVMPSINWGALMGGTGGMTAPGWSYDAYEAYTPYEFETQVADPSAVISSMEPWFAEQREKGFAEAAARMGPSSRGMVASTPYTEALGGVARRSTEDLSRIAAEYKYKAAEQAAQRDLERNLAKMQENLGAYGMQGGWHHEAELASQQYALNQWQAQQQQRQDMLSMMMGGMFGGGGGGGMGGGGMDPYALQQLANRMAYEARRPPSVFDAQGKFIGESSWL